MSEKKITVKIEKDEDDEPIPQMSTTPTHTYMSKSRRNRYNCVVLACMNSGYNSNMTFFSLPTDAGR